MNSNGTTLKIVPKNEYVSATDGRELVVLIAEDDEGNYLLMQQSLKRAGILNKIIHFENGEELLDFLYSCAEAGDSIEKTYVLILDIYMPKVNGIEVLTSIRQHSSLSGIPVIVNSSCDDQETINLCYSLGCVDYKVKPIKVNEIISTFESIGVKFYYPPPDISANITVNNLAGSPQFYGNI